MILLNNLLIQLQLKNLNNIFNLNNIYFYMIIVQKINNKNLFNNFIKTF